MELLSTIINFITHDYWTYIVDMSLVTEESTVGAIVAMSFVLVVTAFGIVGSIIHYINESIRHYKNIAKPALKKLKLNMIRFEFRHLYLPHLESPVECIANEYHHIMNAVKPGMPLDPKVYNALMGDQNRKIMDVLGVNSLKVLEEYMDEPMYLGVAFKKNIEDTYTIYSFKDGKPCDNTSVSTKYFKKFMKHKHFCRMNFGCCKVPVVVITEYGGAKASENIIKDGHDMRMYDHIWNNICFCISRWIPVVAIGVNAPRDSGDFACCTKDEKWYRSRVNAHFIIDKHCVTLVDVDDLMNKDDMETMFEHFYTRENLIHMIGSDCALDIKGEAKKDEDPSEPKNPDGAITKGAITLYPIDVDTMDAISKKSMNEGKGPVDIYYFPSEDSAFMNLQDPLITTGSIAIITFGGHIQMYNIIKMNTKSITFKKIDRQTFNGLVISNDDLSVYRYPSLDAFKDAYRRGNVGIKIGLDLLVVENKDLPDDFYAIV